MASRPLKQPSERASGAAAAQQGFSLEDVKALVQLVEESDVTHIAWQKGPEKVVIRRGGLAPAPAIVHALPAPVAVTAAIPPPPPAPSHAPSAAGAPRDAKLDAPGTVVSSPFVGTFYRSPSPDAPPFVDVGQRVKKGQTICIIEAMKLMNEIESDVDGVVAEIMVPNATPVEFGEGLFRIVPG
jgi:acetyl-CoA carboxylase biotin carboxyl carrier protein